MMRKHVPKSPFTLTERETPLGDTFTVAGPHNELRLTTSDARHAKLYLATVNHAWRMGYEACLTDRAGIPRPGGPDKPRRSKP